MGECAVCGFEVTDEGDELCEDCFTELLFNMTESRGPQAGGKTTLSEFEETGDLP